MYFHPLTQLAPDQKMQHFTLIFSESSFQVRQQKFPLCSVSKSWSRLVPSRCHVSRHPDTKSEQRIQWHNLCPTVGPVGLIAWDVPLHEPCWLSTRRWRDLVWMTPLKQSNIRKKTKKNPAVPSARESGPINIFCLFGLWTPGVATANRQPLSNPVILFSHTN